MLKIIWSFTTKMLQLLICRVGQNHIEVVYTTSIHGIFGREITKYTVIYGAFIRFWPTLLI